MITYLKVRGDRLVGELQEDFNSAFPFLKIEFYKKSGNVVRHSIGKSVTLAKAGLVREDTLTIGDTMSVGELEQIFRDQFGVYVQVSRKSGSLWLETTMTDKWTLRQQNEHGRELSVPESKSMRGNDVDYE